MSLRRHLLGASSALLGGGLVLTTLVMLNTVPPDQEEDPELAPVGMDIAPPPPPPPVVRTPPPRRTRTAPSAPAPALSSSLAGLDFGLGDGGMLGDLAEGLLGNTDSMVMTEDSVDEQPRAVQRVAASYPNRARQRGVTGFVALRILVGADGTVRDQRVEEAEPAGVFEDSALEAVRQWSFEPARYHGQPVRAWARLVVRFDLDG